MPTRHPDLACMGSKVKIGINLPINLKIVLDNAQKVRYYIGNKEKEVTMKRYHKDVYFPVFLDLDGFLKNLPQLTYSKHFLQQLGTQGINAAIARTRVNIFEVYVENGVIEKACISIRVDRFKSYVYVIAKSGYVITAWVTRKEGILCNMNKSLYERGN